MVRCAMPRPSTVANAPPVGCARATHGQHRRADQQHLLQDQDEGRRHDVAGVAADRIEDRLQQDVGRARRCERRLDQAAVGARAAGGELGRQGIDRDGDAVRGRPEDEQIGGIGVDRNMDGGALEHVALGPGRDADHCKSLAAVKRRARFSQFAARIATLTAPLASRVCTIRG